MKILVIGLGSMGRRRIRLIKALNENHELKGVDLSEDRRQQAGEELGIPSYSDLNTAVNDFKPDCAFICTSPISHGKIAIECLNSGINIFTEINLLSDWYDEAMKIAKEKNLKMFLSSTFLYRKEIEYLQKTIGDDRINYIYHTGQYLPDWHPWENYKNFFVGNPKTNGCREIFAIELPWIIKVFGEIKDFYVQKSKLSNLDIDYNDNYMVTFTHTNGNKGIMCVDVIARKAIRNLEVYSENTHVFWNGTPDSLNVYNLENKETENINLYQDIDKDNRYAPTVIENAYTDEIKNFIQVCSGEALPRYSFEQDYKVLELIDKIEGKN